jgi:putative redox protein
MAGAVKTAMREVHSTTAAGAFGQQIAIGSHVLSGDEPREKGGDDTGPSPHELLLAAVASCAAMTAQAYATRKGLALRHVDARARGRHEDGEFVIECDLSFQGQLDATQRARLVEIAGRCPVAKTLRGEIRLTHLERPD